MQHFKEMSWQADEIGGNLNRHRRESRKKNMGSAFSNIAHERGTVG